MRGLLGNSLTRKGAPIDTLAINHMNMLSAEFIDINPDSTLYYSKMAIDRSIVLKYNKGVADGMVQIGKVYTLKGDYDKAKKNLNGAELLYNKINDDRGLAQCYIATGRLYNHIANYSLASDYFNQA